MSHTTISKVRNYQGNNSFVNKMKDVTQYYDTTTDIETGLLSKVREALAEYDKVIDSKVDKVNG